MRTLRLRKYMPLLSLQVLVYTYYVITLFHEGRTPDSGPDPNACRRICRRARSDPRRHAHDAAWKFSSSSHRAFDAVWNRLNPLLGAPGTPGLAFGLPGTQLGCNSPCAVGGDQLPVPGLDVARDPEPRPTSTMLFSSRHPKMVACSYFFSLCFHSPPRWDHVCGYDLSSKKSKKIESRTLTNSQARNCFSNHPLVALNHPSTRQLVSNSRLGACALPRRPLIFPCGPLD